MDAREVVEAGEHDRKDVENKKDEENYVVVGIRQGDEVRH